MKLFILCLLLSLVSANTITKTIDELIIEVKTPTKAKLSLYDPFIRAQPLLNKKVKRTKIKRVAKPELIAVLNNKAFINGRWYEMDEYVQGQRLIKMTSTSVYLKKGNIIKVLTLSSKSMFKTKDKEIK